ncbi:MAG: hypothetical protein EOP83_12735 [Verrucomicrobiaceae bacterium]|nr:MAG: hypothetical protein EOP83_12735 [Verrucomicrobiaceae bacterium]
MSVTKRELLAYPMALIEDRYSGTYSGGRWLAIAKADQFDPDWAEYSARVNAMMMDGPASDDSGAMNFWDNPPEWIAAGETPEAAIEALIDRLSSAINSR